MRAARWRWHSDFSRKAPGKIKTGLVLLISAKTGMGSGASGCNIHKRPTPITRSGKSHRFHQMDASPGQSQFVAGIEQKREYTLRQTAFPNALLHSWPTSSLVPGWAGCALTITGLPAARAEAVSPPATENASGKLLAPKIATGPERIKHRSQIGLRNRFAIRHLAGRSGP